MRLYHFNPANQSNQSNQSTNPYLTKYDPAFPNIPAHPYVHVLSIPYTEITTLDLAICKQPTETLASFYASSATKPKVLCNGGLFDMSTGYPCFHYVDNRVIKSTPSDPSLYYGLAVTNNEPLLSNYNIIAEHSKFTDFISGYPCYKVTNEDLSNYTANELNYKARRTILGYNDSTQTLYIVIVEDPGMNFSECHKLLTEIGITDAINLDGGGSSNLLIDGKQCTFDGDNRAVDNVVAIYSSAAIEIEEGYFWNESNNDSIPVPTPDPNPQPIIYRIQIGAFSNKSYAEAYCEKIHQIPDTIGAEYKNAYVRLVNDLYKVQVGAYSIKENAQRVVNDLKSKGWDAYVTTL